jgi:hypothetical protein
VTPKPLRALAAALLLLILIAAPMWHLHIANRNYPTSKSDLVPVWVGIRAAFHHQDPYSGQTTRQIQTIYYGKPLNPADPIDQAIDKQRFAYPLPAVFVLAPVAILPWPLARRLFLLLMPLLMAATVPAWLRALQIPVTRRRLAILTLLTLVSWPMMWALRQCQFTLAVAAFLAAGCLLLTLRRDALAGIVLALAAIKPQLAGPLLLWLCVWSLLHRRWSLLAGFLTTSAALLAAAQILSPTWISGWLAVLRDYPHYTHAQPMLQQLFGVWLGAALMLILAALAVATLWRSRHAPDFTPSAALLLAVTLALIPTTMPQSYNLVLLLPAVLLLLHTPKSSGYPELTRRIALFFVALEFALVPIAVLGETLTGPRYLWDNLALLNLLLPASVALALLTMMTLDRSPQRDAPLIHA